MDRVDLPADAAQTRQMRDMTDEALASGAVGCSSGLFYEPAMAASTEEVIAVFDPMRRRGGVYCAHMRNEDDNIIQAMEETLRIGRELGVRTVISHHKCVGLANHGRSTRDPAVHRRAHEGAAAVPGLLSLYRLFHGAQRHRAAIAAASSASPGRSRTRSTTGGDLARSRSDMGLPRAQAIDAAAAGGRHLFHARRGRCPADPAFRRTR